MGIEDPHPTPETPLLMIPLTVVSPQTRLIENLPRIRKPKVG